MMQLPGVPALKLFHCVTCGCSGLTWRACDGLDEVPYMVGTPGRGARPRLCSMCARADSIRGLRSETLMRLGHQHAGCLSFASPGTVVCAHLL